MFRLKKVAAIITAMALLPSVAYASRTVDIFAEGFNSVITNTRPQNMELVGSEASRVVERSDNDKSLLIDASSDSSTLNVPITGGERRFFISADMSLEGSGAQINIGFKDAGGKLFYPVSTNENGRLKTHDGKVIGGIGKNYRTLTIYFNLDMCYYTVYSGNRIIAEKWRIPADYAEIQAVTISAQAAETSMKLYVDNLRVYNGDEFIQNKVVSKFNPQSIAYESAEETLDPNRIILKNDFEDSGMEYSGITLVKKDADISIGGDDSNHYIQILSEKGGDCYFEYQNADNIRQLIIESDFRSDMGGLKGNMLYLRDSGSGSVTVNETLINLANGNLVAKNGTRLAKLKPGKFVNIAVALDLKKHTANYYVDGEDVESVDINPELRRINNVRFYISAGTGDLKIDKFRIYGGTQPRDITNEEIKLESVFGSDKQAVKALAKTNAVNGYIGKAVVGDEVFLTDEARIFEEKTYVTAALYERLTGASPKEPAHTDNGVEFYSLTDCIEKENGVYYYEDGHGAVFISRNTITGNESFIKTGHKLVSFERHDAVELKQRFFEQNGENGTQHPRILVTQKDFDRIKRDRDKNEYLKSMCDSIINAANKLIETETCEYIIPDGLRLLDTSKQVLNRIMTLGFAWKITGEERYAQRAYKELESAAAFPNWNAEKHFLDVGEMSCAFGIGYDWLYDFLSEEQKTVVADAVTKFGVKQAYSAYYNKNVWWITTRLNWNVVCNGGTLVGALAIAERDPDYYLGFMYENLKSCEYMWYEMTDGGWEEGVHYWDYVLEYLSFMTSSVVNTFGDDLGLLSYKGVKEFPMFSTYLGSYQGTYNFHDSVTHLVNSPWMYFFANYYNQPDVTNIRAKMAKAMNYPTNVTDALWYNTDVADAPINLPKDKLYSGIIQAWGMHEDYNNVNGSFAAIHGGNTTGEHNHYDTGSFVYDIEGVRWAWDLGWEPYSNTAASDSKYRRRAEGHNVLVVNPDETPGQDAGFSPIISHGSDEASSFVVLDTSQAYQSCAVSAKRGLMLTDSRRSLIVRDEINLKQQSEVYWFMHTQANINILDNKTAMLIQNGKQVRLTLETNADCELLVMDAAPMEKSPKITQSVNTGFSKLVIKLKGNGSVNLTVKLAPMYENADASPMVILPLEQWKPIDGADKSTPRDAAKLDMLYVNGTPITDFSPDKTNYRIDHIAENPAPVITGESKNGYTVSVNTTTDYIHGMTLVTAKDSQGEKKPAVYIITYRYIGPMEDVLGYERHRFYDFTVSSIQQEENPDVCAYDQNQGTRWSANGLGQWAVADLGSEQQIDAVALAFWMGSQRKFKYDILVSNDGENYTKVADMHETSGTTEGYEVLELTPVKARYVKYVGYGNSVNLWNNVIEFAVLKKKG